MVNYHSPQPPASWGLIIKEFKKDEIKCKSITEGD